jgi:hypothetical protein
MYNLLSDSEGRAVFGVGDMSVHTKIDADVVRQRRKLILGIDGDVSNMVVIDGNLSQECIDAVFETCHGCETPVFFEPTDIRQARKASMSEHYSALTYTSPNLNELYTMAGETPPKEPYLQKRKTTCSQKCTILGQSRF